MRILLGILILNWSMSSYAACQNEIIDANDIEEEDLIYIQGYKNCSFSDMLTVGFKSNAKEITEGVLLMAYPVGGSSVMKILCDLTETSPNVFENLNVTPEDPNYFKINTENFFSDNQVSLSFNGESIPADCFE